MVALPLVLLAVNVVDATPLDAVELLDALSVPNATEFEARENDYGYPAWYLPFESTAVTVIVEWSVPFAITQAWVEVIVELARSFATTPPTRHIRPTILIIYKNPPHIPHSNYGIVHFSI